jgi:hypothetical protein
LTHVFRCEREYFTPLSALRSLIGLNPKDKAPIGVFSANERVTAVQTDDSFSQPGASADRACVVVIYGPELGKRAALGQGNFEIGGWSRPALPMDLEPNSRNLARIPFAGQRHVI